MNWKDFWIIFWIILFFWITDKNKISNIESKKEIYFWILSEFLKNRFEYKGFLNAYKHSFRVFSDNTDIYMSFWNNRITQNFDSVITYFDYMNEKDDNLKNTGKFLIRECRIWFSSEYLYIQMNFILNMLQNARKIVLNDWTDILIETLILENEDLEIYRNNFWFFHFKEEKFIANNL